MKRTTLGAICIGILLAGLVTLLLGVCLTGNRPSQAGAGTHRVVKALTAGPPSFAIDISDLTPNLRDMPQKDVEDQLRDWAVYGTLAQLGVSADDLTRAAVKAPPVRLGYLDEAFLYDYGRGRRALVGDDVVLLFYEKSDPDPKATLGRLADKVRMEIGETPELFHVFEIDPDLAAGEIRCEVRAPISGASMYSPEYGYVERRITGLGDFERWLGEIDDVVMIADRGGSLMLGGRRFERSRTRGVTVEDVAALHQAHARLAERRAALERDIERLEESYNVELRGSEIMAGRGASRASIREKYEALVRALKPPPEAPGFSLDPHWNPAGLAEALDDLASDPCRFITRVVKPVLAESAARPSTPDARPLVEWKATAVLRAQAEGGGASACAAISREHGAALRELARGAKAAGGDSEALDRAMVPMWQLQAQLGETRLTEEADALLGAIINFIRARYQVQCARYDGPLSGTRVGMNLFYTDLLAKLWKSVDHRHSAPAAFVPGFLSAPRMRLEPIWIEEERRLPATRIWFGPKPESYTVSQDGDAMWFDQVATRVFAAGSNPAKPDEEEQPAESSRRTIGWWDRHYADVANHEQEYHVQNQIIKWSLITAFKPTVLGFLAGVRVRKDDRFDQWFERERPRLQFQHPIALRPERDWVSGTECLDLLASYVFESSDGHAAQISGGVSAGGRRAIEAASRISKQTPRTLRHTFERAAEGAGTAARARPRYDGGRVIAKLSPQTRTRLRASDLRLGSLEVKGIRDSEIAAKLAITSDRGEVGSLVARRSLDRRVRLSWRSGKVEQERLAEAAAADARGADAATPNPAVEPEVLRLESGGYGATSRSLVEAAGDNPARLRMAIDDLRSKVIENADRRLATGDTAGARQGYRFAGEVLGDASPDVQLRLALADLHGGRVGRGAGHLSRVPAGPDSLRALDALRGKPVPDEVDAFLKLRASPDRPILGVPARQLQLEPLGAEARTVLRMDRRLEGRLLDITQRGAVVDDADGVTVYLDDAFSLNRYDWEVSSNGTLAELASSPQVSWKLVERAGETYMPGMIVEDGVNYARMTQTGALSQGIATTTTATVLPRVLLIRRCDRDGNGDLTDQERAACAL